MNSRDEHAHHQPEGRNGHGHEAPAAGGKHRDHREHHAHMVADFRRRFWVSVVLTVPVLALAPLIQRWLGVAEALAFPGDHGVQAALASTIFFYGGWPFLKGLGQELAKRQPGMMTLISLAIAVAWGYSALVVLGLRGEVFFWELATLIDVMLLGHWIEMRSVMGASRGLEELVRLMPAEAHRQREDGSTEDVPVTDLTRGDRVLVKPGGKIPTDGVIVEGRTSVNEALLTGESRPVEKGEGDHVIAAAINGEAAITVEVRKTGDETYLAQVIELVAAASGRCLVAALGAALVLAAAGCSARVVTLTDRSGVEQELLVRSLERAVARLDLTPLHGRRAVLEVFALTKDEAFAREFVTTQLQARGVQIVGAGAAADVRLRVFASILGVDRGETLFGLPSVPVPVVGLPIPEIALFKWVRHRGLTEVQVYAFEPATGRFLERISDGVGRAKFDQFTVLLVISFTVSDLDERPGPEATDGPAMEPRPRE